ncbi:MAG TPA: Type 1 glutamine amidotransferase-like domain-containing protein [Kofleriaceae bacterium]|nr:Type 1 glutamine amidotransferase-like domain-containing protein [Kofleriaceae bacterium]
MGKLFLLGPQHAQPTVARVLASLGARTAAAITAGWQEREGEPAVLPELGVPTVELGLHARAEDVFVSDSELTAAYKARQTRLRRMQDLYRVRLDRLNQAAYAIALRHVEPELLADEAAMSLALVRALDRDHLARCRAVHAAFEQAWPAAERPSIARHRRELAAQLAEADAVVIAGGHVAVLLNRLRLFDLPSLWGERPILAWSAGAMALCEQVVLFHDDPPTGAPIAEVLDAGLALVRGLVVLPNPRARLHLGDRERVARFAARFDPAPCIALDHGARIELEGGRVIAGAGNQRLVGDGAIDRSWP